MKDIPIGARSITCLPPSSGRPGRLPCRAILPNRDQVLVPGNFVRVRVGAADEHDSLLVPDAALGSDQGGRYLLVLDKENVVEQRKVTIGPKVGDLRVIESGLKPNGRSLLPELCVGSEGRSSARDCCCDAGRSCHCQITAAYDFRFFHRATRTCERA